MYLEANSFPWVCAHILLDNIDFLKLVTILQAYFYLFLRNIYKISPKQTQILLWATIHWLQTSRFVSPKMHKDTSKASIIERKKTLILCKNVLTFLRYFEFHVIQFSLGIIILCILNSLQFFKPCLIIVRSFPASSKWNKINWKTETETS